MNLKHYGKKFTRPKEIKKAMLHSTFFLSFLIEISLSGASFRTALMVPFQLNLPTKRLGVQHH